MANIASSKKDARRSARRAIANRSVRSAVKTKIVRARRAVADGELVPGEVAELAVAAVSALDRAASKGVLHRNNAARRKARLMKQVAATVAAEATEPEAAEAPAGRGAKAGGRGRSSAGKTAGTRAAPAKGAARSPRQGRGSRK